MTLPLCKALQISCFDIAEAIDVVEKTVEIFENFNTDNSVWSGLYNRAKNELKDIHGKEFQFTVPKQKKIIESEPEKYFKSILFTAFINEIIIHLGERFLKHKSLLRSFAVLNPNKPQQNYERDLQNLYRMYNCDLNCTEDALIAEFLLWIKKFEGNKNRQNSVMEWLNNCNENIFPNIFKLIKILATLPLTTCTAERSFSTLKYLKSYLRNTCGQDRLNGLTLLFTQKNEKVEIEEVFDELLSKKRKLDFII